MVMRCTAVANATQAWSYFSDDNYYSDHHSDASFMGGKLAAEHGYAGQPVGKKVFADLLNGRLGEEAVQKGAGKIHRPATDLTFNAPKSFSILARMAGDQRLLEAHRQVVTEVMAFVEREQAGTRVTVNGETRWQATGSLIWSAFHHDTSRDLSAHDHIHVLVSNMTRGPDGKLRALDNSTLFKLQMATGALYHSALRRAVENLGYETVAVAGAKNGEFEIAGVDSDYILAKSSRRAAMMSYLERKGIDPEKATAKQLDIAAKATRSAKDKTVDHEALAAEWRDEWRAMNPDWQPPAALSEAAIAARDGERRLAVVAALDFALAHHLERNNLVSQRDLIATAASEAGTATVDEIERELFEREINGRLVYDQERRCYTTQAAQEREREILQRMNDGRGKMQAIMSEEAADAFLNSLKLGTLNSGQIEAARLFLTSTDRYALVQGVAGAGKTHMLSTIRPALEKAGYKVLGLAPTHQAAGELREKMGQATTLASLLSSEAERESITDKTIVILDEAGMVAAKDIHQFLRIVDDQKARAFYIGDQRQFKAVEAGNPFWLMQQQRIATARMDETVRQKEGSFLRRVVDVAAAGKASAALEMLNQGGAVKEIKKPDERARTMVSAYLEHATAARKEVLMLTGTNDSRRLLNQLVREELGLAGKGAKAVVYQSVDLTVAQRQKAKFYQEGLLLKFNKAYKSLGINARAVLEVVGIEGNTLVLAMPNGKEVKFNPSKFDGRKWNVMEREQLEFAVGDSVRFKENRQIDTPRDEPRAYEFHNNDRGVVMSIDTDARTMEIFNETKSSTVKVGLDDGLFITHGYAMTGYSAQGATVNNALVDFDASARYEAFYTNITRARHETRVFVSDYEAVSKAVDCHLDKANSLDITGRFIRQKGGIKMDYPNPIEQVKSLDPAALRSAAIEAHMMREHQQVPPDYKAAGISQAEFENIAAARKMREVIRPHLDQMPEAQRETIREFFENDAVSQLQRKNPELTMTADLDPFGYKEREQFRAEELEKNRRGKGIAWLDQTEASFMSREGNVWTRLPNGDFSFDVEVTATLKHESPDEYRYLVEQAGGKFNEAGEVMQINEPLQPNVDGLGLDDLAKSRVSNLSQLETTFNDRGNAWPQQEKSHGQLYGMSL